jgi:hypothetical protein
MQGKRATGSEKGRPRFRHSRTTVCIEYVLSPISARLAEVGDDEAVGLVLSELPIHFGLGLI